MKVSLIITELNSYDFVQLLFFVISIVSQQVSQKKQRIQYIEEDLPRFISMTETTA